MRAARLPERWFGPLARFAPEPGSTRWHLQRDRIAMGSLLFLVVLTLAALFAPYLTPYAEQGLGAPNILERFKPPSLTHPFGTDQLGRDVLARVLFGARTSLGIAITTVFAALTVGSLLGAIAGYVGGWIDEAIMRLTDMFLAFPPLLLAITIAAVLGPSLKNTVIAIALTWWPWYTRIVRAQTLSLKERHFVKAARVMGVPTPTILRRHVLPNVLTPVLVQATLDLGTAILTATALSFLGLGVQPPTPDWGVMINEGRLFVQSGYWWVATFPGLAIFAATFAFNLLGDGIQVALDPRSRSAA